MSIVVGIYLLGVALVVYGALKTRKDEPTTIVTTLKYALLWPGYFAFYLAALTFFAGEAGLNYIRHRRAHPLASYFKD